MLWHVRIKRTCCFHPPTCDVRYWHKADNSPAPAFVRFWTTADIVGFWPGTVCPLMTDSVEEVGKKIGRITSPALEAVI
jgi:hypothetical protein